MKNTIEPSILDTGKVIRRSYSFFLENASKTIALLTGIVVTLVTFTEARMCDVTMASYTSTLILMLIASYIIYFSLEDAGEKLGRESEEYRTADEEFTRRKNALAKTDIKDLREYLITYAREELVYRQKNALLAKDLSYDEYLSWLSGREFDKKATRVFKSVKKMKPVALSPRHLLAKEKFERRAELVSPEYRKITMLVLKLIPSTVCMIFTLSVMLGAKDGMTAEFIIESLLKLSTLPIIGLKGYSQGYNYSKGDLVLWIETKSRLIDSYFTTLGQKVG